MTKKTSHNLLPVGFYDLLFDEAEKSHRKINEALDFFLECGYRLIKTPLIEFADNFSKKDTTNSFMLCDVISGKNLVLRNDITLQISRLLDTKLKNANLPLRLCYVGDVLLTKNSELYADRQSTQVGLEIIGCDKEESNLEIIATILEVLEKFSLNNLLIELSIPSFAKILLDELHVQNKTELLEAIREKNISMIKKLASNNADLISEIALRNDNLELLSQKILAKTQSKIIANELERVSDVIYFVGQNFPQIKICCDLFGDDRESYHRDIAFDIFCGDFSYPIVRGGRYEINGIDAVGATIYINHLRKIDA